MATTILIATVGGSCAPVARAVLDHQPDHVYFICSTGARGSSRLVDGPGDVCGETRVCLKCKEPLGNPHGTSIIAQTSLGPDRYAKIEISDPDDMGECFAAIVDAYQRAQASGQDIEVVADYTGGTKTMSAALMRAATGRFARISSLSIVRGERDNLRAVKDGTENAWLQEANAIVIEEQWHGALALANEYQYAGADAVVSPLMRQRGSDAHRVRLQALSTLCRGFDAWDRFDHAHAYALLQSQARYIGAALPTLALLAPLTQPDADPPGWDAAGVLLVYDLCNNADRRAAQGRYDDAMARLYRAIELLAQLRLRGAHGIDTSNIDPAQVAEWLAEHPERSRQAPIRIGLAEAYAVLAAKSDAVGLLYSTRGRALQDVLAHRNASILAHGLRPISRDDYARMREPLRDILDAAREATGLRLRPPDQFPHLSAARFA